MKRRPLSRIVLVLALVGLLPATANATITFKQLGDDMFVVTHRVKIIGSRGQAMDLAYTKAASLCVAAGFSHFEILEEKSEASQSDDSANASVRVRFHFEPGGDRIDCSRNADPKYVQQAQEKLEKQGYRPPTRAASATTGSPEERASRGCGTCTLEQIASMARSGLSDEQIAAACGGDD